MRENMIWFNLSPGVCDKALSRKQGEDLNEALYINMLQIFDIIVISAIPSLPKTVAQLFPSDFCYTMLDCN